MKKYLVIAAAVLLAAGCRKTHEVINNRVDPVDFLSNKKYEKLVVEVQYMNGFIPNTETSTRIRKFLEERLNKSGGIDIVYTSIPAQGKAVYTVEDIRQIELKNRTENVHGKTVAAYILVLDGEYMYNQGNSRILGIAYGSTSMALFGKTIRDFSGDIGEPSRDVLESTVILHEFGHLFGLVNNGALMESAHEDGDHPHHCENPDCLMYYSAETSNIAANLLGGNVPSLDQNCIRDLQRSGGK